MNRRGRAAALLALLLVLAAPGQAASTGSGAATLRVLPESHPLLLVPCAPAGVDPVLCDGLVVWYAPGHRDWDILTYDPAGGTLTARRTGGVPVQGDRIAWIETDGAGRAWLTGPERERLLLPANNWSEGHPVVGEDRLVYERTQNSESGIFLYNLTDGTETAVCTAPGDQRRPWLSGSVVVWEDWRDGTADIYLTDLATGEEQPLAAGPGEQNRPVVSGDMIVWQERESGDGIWQVRLTDLTGSGSTSLEEIRSMKEPSPSLSGDLLLWTERRRGGTDLCLLAMDGDGAGHRAGGQYAIESREDGGARVDEEYRGEIAGDDYAFFATGVPTGTARTSIDLKWDDNESSLLLLISGPDGSVFRFRDEDDGEEDQAVRLSLTRNGRVAPGTWTSAVYGEEVGERVTFTYRWYLEPI
ncbi:hypothetical protein RJ40_08955 [Methanofollis aquaemaris]|uniref:Translocation protein TolB n=1 Tax=Methanofollis aquaemaris TaxID=126734 RepID=A0A8A3S7P7_9EURY|nr:hypothetical protein [Methanofollis aquaemaris]QSZ67626.1 hypothetical protein RJ40_08955 [Methanofollis aquaemaris]